MKSYTGSRAARWRQKVITSGSMSSKMLWSNLHGHRTELQAVTKNGRTYTAPADVLHQLHSHFSALSKEEDGGTERLETGVAEESQKEYGLMAPFTCREVALVMLSLRNGKACGEDQVPNEVLKNGGRMLLQCITKLFNHCLVSRWTPTDWNNELVRLLHKKGNVTLLDNYRGISI